MTDLSEVLPDFDPTPYRHLTHSLEKNDISVAELISLDPIEIAKRCPLPLGDLKAMIQAVIRSLQNDLERSSKEQRTSRKSFRTGRSHALDKQPVVKTLDKKIDDCLAGGIRTGHITEIVGESAVGKTQFALGLLLSAQLKPPHGLGRSCIYLSTEAPLNTTRLQQILQSHPAYNDLDLGERPSLDRVHTVNTNDLETQDHIISHQLPLAVQRFNVGLIVMDSVAANFRAEHETQHVKGLADRAVDLARLGQTLRKIARDHDVAVVVLNQVSDRFDDLRTMQDKLRSSSPLAASSPMPPPRLPPPSRATPRDELMTLDHQQRFFTGWGDQPAHWSEQLKTPALGLSWANQLSARIVLKMESERLNLNSRGYVGGNLWRDRKKRRYVGVVFAPWAPPTFKPVEYEIAPHGIASVSEAVIDAPSTGVDQEMLDLNLWLDGTAEDEEFP